MVGRRASHRRKGDTCGAANGEEGTEVARGWRAGRLQAGDGGDLTNSHRREDGNGIRGGGFKHRVGLGSPSQADMPSRELYRICSYGY